MLEVESDTSVESDAIGGRERARDVPGFRDVVCDRDDSHPFVFRHVQKARTNCRQLLVGLRIEVQKIGLRQFSTLWQFSLLNELVDVFCVEGIDLPQL